MNTILRHRLAFLLLALVGVGTAPLHAQREKLPMEDVEYVEKTWPGAKRTFTGLRYVIVKPGDTSGATPEKGMEISVLYKGMLLDGTVFDQSPDEKHPLTLRLGRGNLIEGWEQALQMMHKGEKWILIVPPEMAYGARGKPPTIKRNKTLVFEMELVDFKK